MNTLTALVMWVLVSAGLVDHGCYEVLVGPGVDIVAPPPPPSDTPDSQCTILDDPYPNRRPQISNGF